jgi:hypothetical protein
VKTYRSLPVGVHHAERRLRIVTAAATRGEDETVEDIARAYDCSPSLIYKLTARLKQALAPRPPGPRPAAATHTRIVLTPPADDAPRSTPPVDPRRAILEMAVSNVTIRGIQRLLGAMGAPTMDRERIVDFLRRAGRAARRLLSRAAEQLRDRVQCLAGDDIFFHRTAVKVLIEPTSGAVVEVMRWRWREKEDWALFLDQWPSLKLLVSDLGTDLVGAANLNKLAHQADLLHERVWWTEHVFTYLSRREQRRAAEAMKAWDRATRPVGPGRRATAQTVDKAEARRAEAEEDFFCAMRAERLHIELFSALAPDGRRWSDAQIEDHFAQMRAELSSLPEWCREKVLRHLEHHRARWTGHRVLWDLLEVRMREGSTLEREALLDAVVALWWSEHRVVVPGSDEAARASCEAWRLRRQIEACCENAAEVMAAVSSLIERPRRSSSLVEALNSRLRVLQMVHRNVSDHLLALVALRWNLTTRIEGRRRGSCPFVDLGIDFADGVTPWYQTLLEELDAD